MTATFHWHNDRAVHHLARRARTRQRRDAGRQTALVDRASQRRLAGNAQAHARRWAWAGWCRTRSISAAKPSSASAAPRPHASCRRWSSALRMRLPIGGGTDAHRVMAPNPFVALQWMLDGKTVSGIAMRAPAELPTRDRGAAPLHAGQRLVQLRGERARRARSRASSPISRCSTATTSACRSARSAAPSRC